MIANLIPSLLPLSGLGTGSNHRRVSRRVRISYTDVKIVPLYGARNWTAIRTIIKREQIFVNSCLLKIQSAITYHDRVQIRFELRKKLTKDNRGK